MHTPYRLSAALLMFQWLAGQTAFAANAIRHIRTMRPIVPDISLSSFDEAAMDDGRDSPDRPLVIYFLGPFFSPLRLTLAPGLS
jgi:hypothetical protein